ncbi:MAG: hypothetical protein WD768_08875 [Phycisphaeraceae bacterium]
MKEYDIFVPLFHNDGRRIDRRVFRFIHRAPLDQFNGVTFFPQPNQGSWRAGGVTYRDRIVVYRVLCRGTAIDREFLVDLKVTLKRELQQEEILIIERDVKTL